MVLTPLLALLGGRERGKGGRAVLLPYSGFLERQAINGEFEGFTPQSLESPLLPRAGGHRAAVVGAGGMRVRLQVAAQSSRKPP